MGNNPAATDTGKGGSMLFSLYMRSCIGSKLNPNEIFRVNYLTDRGSRNHDNRGLLTKIPIIGPHQVFIPLTAPLP